MIPLGTLRKYKHDYIQKNAVFYWPPMPFPKGTYLITWTNHYVNKKEIMLSYLSMISL